MQKATWSMGYSGIWLDDSQGLWCLILCTVYQCGRKMPCKPKPYVSQQDCDSELLGIKVKMTLQQNL